jgi:hypothetical protein
MNAFIQNAHAASAFAAFIDFSSMTLFLRREI